MKSVCIVYNQPLTAVQGINYVNSSFVEGQKYFIENGLELKAIYSPNEKFVCENKRSMDIVGSDIGTTSYKRKRRFRIFLRKLFSSAHLPGALIKIFFNHFYNAKKAVKRMLEDYDNIDYIIFQDIFSARYYQKLIKSDKRKKNILILHCSNHELEQLKPNFTGVFKHKIIGGLLENYLHSALLEVDKVVYLSRHAMNKSQLCVEQKAYIYNGKEDIEHHCIYPPSNPLNFVIVASVTYHKGHHLLLEALSLLKEEIREKLHLYIIGGGNEFDEFKKLSEDLHVQNNVTFMGNRKDVADQLKKMDVFILPSLSEGMPMSILEAMRQGLYIIATPVGGIPEMIHSSFGKFVERETRNIAEIITEVVNSNVVSIESKRKSRTYYEDFFTLKKMILSYSDLLNALNNDKI